MIETIQRVLLPAQKELWVVAARSCNLLERCRVDNTRHERDITNVAWWGAEHLQPTYRATLGDINTDTLHPVQQELIFMPAIEWSMT